MITPAEHWVYKDSKGITLERGLKRGDLSWQGFERLTARSAIGALGELSRDLARPLDFGITRRVVEEVDGIPGIGVHVPRRWNWYLTTPDTPQYAHSAYVDPVEVKAETIDEASMFEVAARALDDPDDVSTGQWVEWEEMYVHDTMAHVPQQHGPADHLVVDDYDNRNADVHIPLIRADDGTTWAHRAHMVTWPPLSMDAHNHTGTRRPDHEDFDTFIQLRIHVNWSLWWEKEAPGHAILTRTLDRLHTQGWT
ncbi:hypothetical protein K8Z49_26765 [Actinomadura madurae]|uniref:hypothetical protein n=1 Tax=Actinomadura madurae TaxID=1993 RepID=UPI00399A1577